MDNIYTEPGKKKLADTIHAVAFPLKDADDLGPLLDRIGDAKIVLLGEASHGTHEYYAWRSRISRRLIGEKGFSFIAVEGDWPDCYRINRYVKSYPDAGASAQEVLHAFNRWPTWMWANWEVVELAEWLLENNRSKPKGRKAGFYGLDMYSLWESLEAIIEYLEKVDPQALEVARKAFLCFEPYSEGGAHAYAQSAGLVPYSCQQEVIDLLREIRFKVTRYNTDPEAVFNVEQNAQIAFNAEQYYRSMVAGGPDSWNIRDRHMTDTLNALLDFHGEDAKAIVWEHNTHIGDARATDMARAGMVNVGMLLREQYEKEEVVAVGFGSYEGTVIAGRYWGDVMKVIHMPPAVKNSWEDILHPIEPADKLILMNELSFPELERVPVPHRAVGVVYNPESEKHGNYVPTLLPLRYDAFMFFDKTTALHPLHISTDPTQMPETFPFGL